MRENVTAPDGARWEAPPSDYTLIVPDGWFQIKLDPEFRDRGIIALADQQFRGIDNAPHLKEELMSRLQKRAKESFKAGGIELYISTMTAGPLPLASSLLVTLLPPDRGPGATTPHDLVAGLTADDAGADVRVVALPAAGQAVREHRREVAVPGEQLGNTLPTTTVTYHVPVPATPAWLMLTFSTPMEPLVEPMVELFDTVAGTLQWS